MKNIKSVVAILLMNTVFISACSESEKPQLTNTADQTTEKTKKIEDVKATESEIMADDTEHDFQTLDDRFSYAYGADLAEKFKAEGIELNVDILATAMRDAFKGGEMKMPDDEVIATLSLYQEVFLKKKEKEKAIAGEKNKKEGAIFLAENAKKEGVVITESGLQYRVITAGDGGYKPKFDDEVQVHYRATFIDGTEFDSTHKRGEPYSVKAKMLIDGWAEALQLMTAGAKWELTIPAELAYGEQGSDPYIGPNAVLIFEVELLEIEEGEEKEIATQ
ncbi:MAG: FKBP-type peptidyl-prolyl cis-trans isomerase [Cellvibrionaceae bacterium]